MVARPTAAMIEAACSLPGVTYSQRVGLISSSLGLCRTGDARRDANARSDRRPRIVVTHLEVAHVKRVHAIEQAGRVVALELLG